MPVTDLLERNHKLYGEEVALVELNPTMKDTRKTTWKEYDLVHKLLLYHIAVRLHGAYLMRRQTVWQICCKPWCAKG